MLRIEFQSLRKRLLSITSVRPDKVPRRKRLISGPRTQKQTHEYLTLNQMDNIVFLRRVKIIPHSDQGLSTEACMYVFISVTGLRLLLFKNSIHLTTKMNKTFIYF